MIFPILLFALPILPNFPSSKKDRSHHPPRPWWDNPKIHNFGNSGLGGRFHAQVAKFATRVIDRVAYGGRDIRKEVLQQLPAGARVVDFGCGVGLSTARGALGVDTSREMLSVAKRANPRCDFVRGNAVSFGNDVEFDIVTVFFLLHEAPSEGRMAVLQNAVRVAADTVIIVDISPQYEPSVSMLSGEPYVTDYLASIDMEIEAVCYLEGATLRTFDVIDGHVKKWHIDTRKGARLAKSGKLLSTPIHGMRMESMQASGANLFNTVIDATRHNGVDVRREFANFINQTTGAEELLPAQQLVHPRPISIVELGCGVGSLTVKLRRALPAANIVALDAHSAMVAEAEENFVAEFGKDATTVFLCTNGVDVETVFQSSSLVRDVTVGVASFVFHELPRAVSQEMIRKTLRVTSVIFILDVDPRKVENHENGVLQAFEPFLGEFITFFELDLAARYDVTCHPFPVESIKLWEVRDVLL